MRRNQRFKNQSYKHDQDLNSSNAGYNGHTYFKSPTFLLNSSQTIMDNLEEYIPDFGADIRFRSCGIIKK